MPLPKTQDVGKMMHAMKGEDMPHKQKVAIALSQAKKAGAKIPVAEAAVKKVAYS